MLPRSPPACPDGSEDTNGRRRFRRCSSATRGAHTPRYEPTAPKHHWSEWYAAYIVARSRAAARTRVPGRGRRLGGIARNRLRRPRPRRGRSGRALCRSTRPRGGVALRPRERELLGGECSYWGCIPPRPCCGPARRWRPARTVPGAAKPSAAPWTCGGARLAPTSGLELRRLRAEGVGPRAGSRVIRGQRPLAGPHTGRRRRDGYTAGHRRRDRRRCGDPARAGRVNSPACGRNGEVTGLTEVPTPPPRARRRAIGVEMAQAVTRLGRRSRSSGGRPPVEREAARAGRGGRHASGRRRRAPAGPVPDGGPSRGSENVQEFADGSDARGDRLLVAGAGGPGSRTSGLDTVGIAARPERHPRRRPVSAGPGLWAIEGRQRAVAADPCRGVQGTGRGVEHPRPTARSALRGGPAGDFCDPQAPRSAPRTQFVATVPSPASRGRPPTPGRTTPGRVPDLVSDGERLHTGYALGRAEAVSGSSRRTAASGPALRCGAARRHPAVPDVLRGDLPGVARPRRPGGGPAHPRPRRRTVMTARAGVAACCRCDGGPGAHTCPPSLTAGCPAPHATVTTTLPSHVPARRGGAGRRRSR